MSRIFSLCLYHTSFLPLWVSILFIDIRSVACDGKNLMTEQISIGCILISLLVSAVVLLVGLCINVRNGSAPQTLISASEEKSITAEYLLSYILPLFAFDFTRWDQVVLFLIFYSTLGFLCMRHHYFSVNVMLEICNYRFYKCSLMNEDGQKTHRIVISHRRLNGCVGDTIWLKSLNNEYKLDIKQ